MADLYQYNQETGLVIPQTSDLKEQTQNEYVAAFGSDLVLNDATPQGVLIENETSLKVAMIHANANMVNGFNWKYAQGLQLDAILDTFNTPRLMAQPSSVLATVYGVNGTLIPEGSLAQTNAGDVFASTSDVTIGVNGTATVYFQSVEGGAIPCPVNALNFVLGDANRNPIPGWEQVGNFAAATLGYSTESDYKARKRFKKSQQKAPGYVESFYTNLLAVSGVLDCWVYDNGTNSTVIYEGVPIDAHSVVVLVNGGSNQNIFVACDDSKDAGCGYTSITQTYAYGKISYTNNLSEGDTITIGSTTLTAGTDFNVGDKLTDTIENIVALSVSGVTLAANPDLYSIDVTATTAGTSGNSIALAASSGLVSASTLTGGSTEDLHVSGNVLEPISGAYYNVTFNRPIYTDICMDVIVSPNAYSGDDLKTDVENAIMNWAAGNVAEVEGLHLGIPVNSYEVGSAITVQIPECRIVSVLLGNATGIQATGSIEFAGNLQNGNVITIGTNVLTAGTSFEIGETLADTLLNISLISVKNFNLSVSSDTLTITYKYSGAAGNGQTLSTTAEDATVTAMYGGVNNGAATLNNFNIGRIGCGRLSVANVKVSIL